MKLSKFFINLLAAGTVSMLCCAGAAAEPINSLDAAAGDIPDLNAVSVLPLQEPVHSGCFRISADHGFRYLRRGGEVLQAGSGSVCQQG